MKNDFNQIDEFYRKALKNHTQNASAYTRVKMRWRLFWLNYKGYILGIGATAILVLGIYFFTGSINSEQQNSVTEKSMTTRSFESGPIYTEPAITQAKKSNLSKPSGNQDRENTSTPGTSNFSANNNNLNIINDATPPEPETTISNNTNEVAITANTDVKRLPGISPTERSDFKINSLAGKKIELAALDTGFLVKTPYDIKLKKNRISIGFYVAPSYTGFALKAAAGYEDHLKYRNEHEGPAISVSTGVNIRLNMRNWYIQTGLEYSEFRQTRNYNNSFQALDSLNSYFQTDTIWGWVFDPPDIGKPIILGYDTIFVPVYNTTQEGYNRWKYLEVPLTGGYKFNRGRFGFEVSTGFSCGFLLDARGNVPDLNDKNRFTELNDLNDEMNKYLFNYIFQAGFTYHLTPAWSLSLSPFYKQNLNSVFKNNYPVDQKFRSFGINFGLKVDL